MGAVAGPPLVFVHGIKGSHLRSVASGKRKYITARQALLPLGRQATLGLPATWSEEGVQGCDDLEAEEPIVDLRLGPISIPLVYQPFVNWASQWASKEGRHYCSFAYDWRRDLAETGSKLEKFLERVAAGGSQQRCQVVAHSMGSLVVVPVLNRRPELFHSVLFVAGAMGSGIGFLPDLSLHQCSGNYTGLNKTLLGPGVWCSCPSPFHFFPLKEDTASDGGPSLVNADGTAVEVDFHSVADWKRLQLGPWHPESGCRVTPAMEEFIATTLGRARGYRKSLVCNPQVAYPPLCALVGDAQPTPLAWSRPGPGQPFNLQRPVRTGTGDGRVIVGDGLPPQGIPCEVTVTRMGHLEVLNDTTTVQALLESLLLKAQAQSS